MKPIHYKNHYRLDITTKKDINLKIKPCSPTGPIGIEINGVIYKEPEATEISKHYAHILALEIVNKYRNDK